MWQGITVSGGFVEIKNNGKIENAICAIMVKDDGILEATNAHFENNIANNGIVENSIANNGIIISNASATWAGNNQLLSVPVTLQARATLTNIDTISSNEHTTITVHPGAKIVVDGGIFKNATGQFWQGITVLGNNDAPFTQNYQGFIQLKNNAKIENAVCGITVTGGGMVAATDAHFINNTVGVKFETVASRQSTISGRFTQTNFVLNDSYMGNMTDFETHLKMESSGEVRVIGCNFSSTVLQNSSTSNKNYGIMASNTSLTVKDYCYGAIINPDGSCPDNIPSVFSGFSRAISANSSGRSPLLRVSYSIFNNNLRGINISGINNHELIRNQFNLTASNSYGVHISNATGYKIEENVFENTATTSTRTVGLRIGNSGSAENEVYKNYYYNLYVAQQFVCKNSSQVDIIPPDTLPPSDRINQITGLQSLCNTFTGSQYRDILVGHLPNPPIVCVDGISIRKDQGSRQESAGNLFYGSPILNIENDQSQHLINYHCPIRTSGGNLSPEFPTNCTNVTIYSATSNPCPSRVGIIGGGDDDLHHALVQYDEWNGEYENWLTQFLAFEDNNEEEYNALLDMVSYYSALKDNHFNSIIIAINDEIQSSMEYEIRGDEGTDGKAGRGGLNLRYLLLYRGNYTDYLSVVETYLKENNYREAMATLVKMYERFEIIEEQALELNDLRAYIHWLLQLEAEENSIYTLSHNEIEYLVNYVETRTGRGRVFAKIILCELYEICIEDEEEEGRKGKGEGNKEEEETMIEPVINNTLQIDGKELLDKITVIPNPTKGDLQVISYGLQVTSVEIFDVFGRKALSHHLITSSSNQKIDISHLNSGIYFIKVVTNQGEIVKKVVKQ
jgi:hypothetical protein